MKRSNGELIASRAGLFVAALAYSSGLFGCRDNTAPAFATGSPPTVVTPAPTAEVPDGRLAFELEVLPTPTASGVLPRIYTMRTDGSDLRALSPAGDIGRAPAWSPDGSQLAYESYHGDAPEVWIVGGDGTGRTRVARGGTDPFWLDADHVGYQCGWSLCAVRADGSEQRTLLSRERARDAEDFAYSISADGKTIAFTRITIPGPARAMSFVYFMNTDGTGERALTTVIEADSPHWSPVGRSIAFASAVFGTAVANADSGTVRSLSRRSGVALPFSTSSPGWSPTGTYVVFGLKMQSIYFARADGTGPIIRVNTPFFPDGFVNAWAWTTP